jgi:hypothetical protein
VAPELPSSEASSRLHPHAEKAAVSALQLVFPDPFGLCGLSGLSGLSGLLVFLVFFGC